MALTTNLVSYWKFDESSGNAADSVGSNTLTNNATATYAAAKINNGAVMNGSSQYFSIADASQTGLDLSGDFSFSLWVKFAALPSDTNFILISKSAVNNISYDLWLKQELPDTNYYLNLRISDDGAAVNNLVSNSYAFTTATLYYITVVFTASTSTAQFYVNATGIGAPVGTMTSVFNGTAAFHIGRSAYSAVYYLNGAADEGGVWNRTLSGAEVTSLYNGGYGVQYPFTGITFGEASNSGDIAAASSFSGAAVWNGENRILAVDVSMLGAGVTVTAMTYGGATCTLIGVKSTVTSFGRVECWRITSSDSGAPAVGSNTLSVTLSGSLEFVVEWVAYTGVHQTTPIEAFNSAQATNVGSADNATVNITTVADLDWVHAAVVANDTSITAGNTTRNNISGTLGSGANEDNNAPKTPAGSVTMFYTGLAITATWAIAGYGLRPISAVASGPANLKTWNGLATASVKTLNGLAIASVKTWNGLA